MTLLFTFVEASTCPSGQSCTSFPYGTILCSPWGNYTRSIIYVRRQVLSVVALSNVFMAYWFLTGPPISFWLWTIPWVSFKSESNNWCWNQRMAGEETEKDILNLISEVIITYSNCISKWSKFVRMWTALVHVSLVFVCILDKVKNLVLYISFMKSTIY